MDVFVVSVFVVVGVCLAVTRAAEATSSVLDCVEKARRMLKRRRRKKK